MGKKIKVKDLLDAEMMQEHLPALTEFFDQGGTWQMLMGMSDGDLESQYAVGYEHYNAARYAEATQAFTSLTVLNPYEPKYWFALGATRHQSKDYSEALQAYLLSSAIDEQNPLPLLQAGHCADQIGKPKEALDLLQQAIQLGGDPEVMAEAHSLANQLRGGKW